MAYETRSYMPEWLSDKGAVNEVLFCTEFLKEHPMKFVEGKFVSVDGILAMDAVRSMIGKMMLPYVSTGFARKVKSAAEALQYICRSDKPGCCRDEIHVRNGILKTSGRFIPEKRFCVNRLNVVYDEKDHLKPAVFLRFLSDMLDDDDILTLQEYLGYCLIPSTKGQAMMFIIGNGGEGKSRIGVVMKEIFGEGMIESKLHRIESDRFARANLQNKLLMIDDDMQLEALTSTGYIKNLVTAETPVDIEIKGQQSFQAEIYARFLCFSNGSPKALYDRTEGLGRRLIILTTKPVPKDRKTDRYIAEKMIEEKDRIFRWMFEGLQRLIANNFCFTISDKAKENVSDMMSDNCNVIDFLKETSLVSFGADKQISSMDLYESYKDWCEVNALTPLKRDTLVSWLKSNQDRYAIRYDCNVKSYGRRVRGFVGLYALRAAYKTYGV